VRQFPWDEVIAIGLGLLRLSSRDFWAMSPREFAHVAQFLGGGQVGAPERGALETLMAMFPDNHEGRTR
jgi:uncharacterized phage protein (TIGR02216 family)